MTSTPESPESPESLASPGPTGPTGSGFGLDDVRSLLTEEMESTELEVAMFRALTGAEHLLLAFVAACVAERDVAALKEACHASTPLHELLARRSDAVGEGPAVAPYNDSEHSQLNALRALASLGLALVDDESEVPGHAATALAWFGYAHIFLPVATDLRQLDWSSAYSRRLGLLAELLADEPLGFAVVLWAAQLGDPTRRKDESAKRRADGAKRAGGRRVKREGERQAGRGGGRRDSAAIETLLDEGETGRLATLEIRMRRDLPAALVPDLWSMALFSADDGFLSGLRTAWDQGGRLARGTALWRLTDPAGPVDQVRDISLTGAFTVAVNQLCHTSTLLVNAFVIRRITAGTAVVGGVDDGGRMVPVSGYRQKIGAAEQLHRVVVPSGNVAEAQRSRREPGPEIVGVGSWKEAAKKSRKVSRPALMNRIIVTLVAASLIGGGTWWHQRTQADAQNARNAALSTAASVAQQARAMAGGDSDGLALLLALASDDVAADNGGHPTTLQQILEDDSSLVRIQQAPNGIYAEAAIDEHGDYSLLDTDAGNVQLIDMTNGDVVFQHQYGPGQTMNQVMVDGLAFSPTRDQAAYATSDLKVDLLAYEGSQWSADSTLTVPAPTQMGALGVNMNSPHQLRFSPDGNTLYVSLQTTGVYAYDLAEPSRAPEHCALPKGDVKIAATQSGLLVATATTITQLTMSDCASKTLLTVPSGGAWAEVAAQADGTVVGLATNGAQLLAISPGTPAVTLSNDGPFSNVQADASTDGLHVTAATTNATVGWLVGENAEQFAFRATGFAAASDASALWIHGQVAEVERPGINPMAEQSIDFADDSAVAWAGENLLVRGYSRVMEFPDAAQGMSEQTAHQLPLAAAGGVSVETVTGSSNGRWAATVAYSTAAKRLQLYVADLTTWKNVPVKTTCIGSPVGTAFADGGLYVGYSDAKHHSVCSFGFDNGTWVQSGTVEVSADPVALAARDGDPDIYAVGWAQGKPLSAIKIRRSSLAVMKTSSLPGTPGNAIPVAAILSDGEIVFGYGLGRIVMLDAALATRAEYDGTNLNYVTGLAEDAGARELIVAGVTRTVVLSLPNLTLQAGGWASAGLLSGAATSSDGKELATSSLLSMAISVWSLDTADIRERACKAVGRDLTPSEWNSYFGPSIPYRPVCGAYLGKSSHSAAPSSAASMPAPPASASPRALPKVSPSLYSQPGPYSAADLALIHQISGAVLSPCSSEPSQENSTMTSVLNCTPVKPGPTTWPLLIVKFSSAKAMTAWLDKEKVSSAPSQDCLGGAYTGTWAEGGVACRLEQGGDLRIFWTDSADLIGAIADGPQNASYITWWQGDNAFTISGR